MKLIIHAALFMLLLLAREVRGNVRAIPPLQESVPVAAQPPISIESLWLEGDRMVCVGMRVDNRASTETLRLRVPPEALGIWSDIAAQTLHQNKEVVAYEHLLLLPAAGQPGVQPHRMETLHPQTFDRFPWRHELVIDPGSRPLLGIYFILPRPPEPGDTLVLQMRDLVLAPGVSLSGDTTFVWPEGLPEGGE